MSWPSPSNPPESQPPGPEGAGSPPPEGAGSPPPEGAGSPAPETPEPAAPGAAGATAPGAYAPPGPYAAVPPPYSPTSVPPPYPPAPGPYATAQAPYPPTSGSYPPHPGLYQPGPPGYGPLAAQPPGFNGLAIASFVVSFLACLPLSITFGIIALVQMRRTGERGRGLAIAGLVLSGVWLLCIGAGFANGLARQAERDGSGQVVDGGQVSVFDLRVGDCIESLPDRDQHYEVQVVPCLQLHEAEVYAVFELPGSSYPGEDELFALADEECFDRLESYSYWAANDPGIEVYYLYPTSESWRVGDREITCIAISDSPRIGSIRG